jgi:Bacterial regulatory proteins, luxR family.
VSVPELSLTEERIVLLLAGGWSKREVAADVGLDERTVDWHVARATRKLERASALHERVRRAVSSPPMKETSRAEGVE